MTGSKIEIVDWSNWRVAKLNGVSSAQDVQSLISSGAANGVTISRAHGYQRGGSIRFLNSLTGLKAVVVQDPDFDAIDISVLSELSDLEFLAVGDHKQSLDIKNLSQLRELRLAWNAQDKLPAADECKLVTLALSSFKSKDRDLTTLAAYRHLEFLEVIQGNTESLRGIAASHP